MRKEQLSYMKNGVMQERKKQVRDLLKISLDEYMTVELEMLYGKENADLIAKYIDRKYRETVKDYVMCMEQKDLDDGDIPSIVTNYVQTEKEDAQRIKDDKRTALQNKIAETYRLELNKLNRDLIDKINDLTDQADITEKELSSVEEEIFGDEIANYVSEEDLNDLRRGKSIIKRTRSTLSTVDRLFKTEDKKQKQALVTG